MLSKDTSVARSQITGKCAHSSLVRLAMVVGTDCAKLTHFDSDASGMRVKPRDCVSGLPLCYRRAQAPTPRGPCLLSSKSSRHVQHHRNAHQCLQPQLLVSDCQHRTTEMFDHEQGASSMSLSAGPNVFRPLRDSLRAPTLTLWLCKNSGCTRTMIFFGPAFLCPSQSSSTGA